MFCGTESELIPLTVGRNEYMIIARCFGSCPRVMTGGVQLQLEKHIQTVLGREGIPWTTIKNSVKREFRDFDKSYESQRNELSKCGVFRA